MISSVSSVGFKGAAVSGYDPISRPGKYTTMPKEKSEGKSSHKALKVIAGLVATAIAAGALLVVGKNKNWFKGLTANELANAGIKEKCSHYLNVAAEFVDKKCWAPIKDFGTKALEWVKNLRAPKNTPAA